MDETTDSSEAYIKLLAWFHANRTKVLVVGVIVALIALVAGIMAWQKADAQNNANSALYAMPLAVANGNQVTPLASGPLLDVAQKYPDTTAGEYAELLAAESFFLEAKYSDAEHAFSKFIDAHPESDLVAQAKVGVAASLEAEGKLADAAQKYQAIIVTYPSEANIASPAKLTLARLDEEQNKPEQALTYYEDLARVNNPYDPWSAEARERGALLLSKHPELRKAPPTSTRAPSAMSQPGGLNFSSPAASPNPAAPPAGTTAPKILSIPSAPPNGK
ncbi:MAG TPA: tetratricopeptide repeat protein [Candidatus Saccharimonadales bacterium]|nr:tetratricopeptide repeat protein [Candidatus Saccharimonadales bacterium]